MTLDFFVLSTAVPDSWMKTNKSQKHKQRSFVFTLWLGKRRNNYSIFPYEKNNIYIGDLERLKSTAGVILHASNYTDATHNSLGGKKKTPLFWIKIYLLTAKSSPSFSIKPAPNDLINLPFFRINLGPPILGFLFPQ